jgi:hypothetical protein
VWRESAWKPSIAETNKIKETPMKGFGSELSKIHVSNKVIVFEELGFLASIVICWLTELIDPPFSFTQVILETFSISLLGYWIISTTSNLIKRVKYLEGFVVICAECKQVRLKEKWRPIEELVVPQSDIRFSHSLCPPCTTKLYAEFHEKKADCSTFSNKSG